MNPGDSSGHFTTSRKNRNRTYIHVFIFISALTHSAYFEFDLVNSTNEVVMII